MYNKFKNKKWSNLISSMRSYLNSIYHTVNTNPNDYRYLHLSNERVKNLSRFSLSITLIKFNTMILNGRFCPITDVRSRGVSLSRFLIIQK